MPIRRTSQSSGAAEREESRPPESAWPRARRVMAIEFVRRMRGASQPFLMRCDDSRLYVVKFRNNPQHARVLANEMLAGRLARRLGLPVPDRALVEVSPELITASALLRFELGGQSVRCDPGIQFGSCFPGAPGRTLVVDFLPDRLLRRVENLASIFLGAFALDKWTCNCDGRQIVFHREAGQEGPGYAAFLIDHGFCFNDGEWNFPDSPIRSLYPRRMVYESVRGLRSFEPYLSRIENLEPEELEDSVRDIPTEWCGEETEQLSRLVERLYERRRRVRQLIIDAKNTTLRPFPNWE